MLRNFFGPTEFEFAIDIGLSLVSGFLIGIERESRGKDAGIGTYTMVITGSMLFTFLSLSVDPMSTSRIAAQVVTGIGFLGAGIIFREGGSIKNLTTAANIWFAGAIGMAFGFGYHAIALMSTFVAIVVPRISKIFHKKIHIKEKEEKPKN